LWLHFNSTHSLPLVCFFFFFLHFISHFLSSIFSVPKPLAKRKIAKHIRGKGFWGQHENRRKFLIDLATSKGLDPFDPHTWQNMTLKDIVDAKVSF
jgi:hypothetical protein